MEQYNNCIDRLVDKMRRVKSKTSISPRSAALIILISVVVLIAIISIIIYNERSKQENYIIAVQRLNVEAKQITEHYDEEYAKWNQGLIDDPTMIEIMDSVMINQQRVISMLKNLDVPDVYKEAHKYNVQSLEYEYQSNEHFKKYLETKDQNEYKKSQELFQLAFEYEMKALNLYRSNGLFVP